MKSTSKFILSLNSYRGTRKTLFDVVSKKNNNTEDIVLEIISFLR